MSQKNKIKKKRSSESDAEKADVNVRQIALMLAASAVLFVVACVALNSLGFFHMVGGWFVPRGNVKFGLISEEGEVSSIPAGEVYYRLNTDVVFDNSYGRGTLMFENPSVSLYDLEFCLYLPGDRENAVYISPKLKPGECIVSDKLTRTVSKGSHACVCIINAYDSNGEYCGRRTSTVNLKIIEN